MAALAAWLALGLMPARADTTVGCDAAALIAAIDYANAHGGDSIDLAPGCTYTFIAADNFWYGPNALPPIASNIVIHGHGAVLKAQHSGD
ncbi:MAG: hypothetical protein L0H70_10020, partial [Xanthomonadales bacterium]|nr:hypothetical protein [Xanthomonadales bacterium]